MRRPISVAVLLGFGVLAASWILFQTPGSLTEVLSQPFHAFLGTQKQLNSTLLEVSETAEPVRSASRRLLQPLGAVRLVRIYDAPDSSTTKKR